MVTAPVSTAGRRATNGADSGKNPVRNQRQPMVDQAERPQGKKKRNRSKKKRGKGGGVGGNEGAPEIASARGAAASSAGVTPRRQKPRDQTPKQQLDQCQQHQPGTPASSTSSHPRLPPSTTEGRTKMSDTASARPEDLCEGMELRGVRIVHETGSHQRARVAPTRAEIGHIARRKSPRPKAADPTTRSVTVKEDLAVEARDVFVDEGLKRTVDSATNAIAPFECSRTNASNVDSEGKKSKSPPEGKHPTGTLTLS